MDRRIAYTFALAVVMGGAALDASPIVIDDFTTADFVCDPAGVAACNSMNVAGPRPVVNADLPGESRRLVEQRIGGAGEGLYVQIGGGALSITSDPFTVGKTDLIWTFATKDFSGQSGVSFSYSVPSSGTASWSMEINGGALFSGTSILTGSGTESLAFSNFGSFSSAALKSVTQIQFTIIGSADTGGLSSMNMDQGSAAMPAITISNLMATPEPGGWLLVTFGLCGMAWRGYRGRGGV